MEWIDAKAMLHPVKPTDHYLSRDFNMNIYRGCSHGCIYCDSRSACYHIQDFDRVRAKRDAVGMVERELQKKRKAGLVGTGAASDPYNPWEERCELTRGALEAIARHGFGISVITKAPLAARDADLYARIAREAPAAVHLTITAMQDELSRRIEPGVAPSSERFKALGKLAASGVYAGVMITPVLPFLTDSPQNVAAIAERAAACGATHAVCMPGMTLRTGDREYYYAALDHLYPGLSRRYAKTYGEQYICDSPNAQRVWEAFANACERNALAYEFPAINREIAAMWKTEQMSLL